MVDIDLLDHGLLRNAAKEGDKSSYGPKYDQIGLVKTLESQADQHNQEVKAKSQEQMEGSDQWNKFLDDDDTWKKKNAYDE